MMLSESSCDLYIFMSLWLGIGAGDRYLFCSF